MRAIVLLCLFFLPATVSAQELAVITSFPTRMTEAYAGLWAKVQPASKIRVLHKNTVAAIDEIARGNERRFDIFMVSSPEAFELLAQRVHLHLSKFASTDQTVSSHSPCRLWVGHAEQTVSCSCLASGTIYCARPIKAKLLWPARPARVRRTS